MSESHTLKDFVRHLAEERGVDLRAYKVTTVERRVRHRMRQLGIGSYDEYLEYTGKEPAEKARLVDTVLINVTRFFRDPQAWEILNNKVLPMLFKDRQPGSSFRVWSAGCATGEEPYSVAILLCEMLGPQIKDYDLKIYATDHDASALNAARHGEYPADSVRGVRPEIRAKYFTGNKTVRVVRDVRRMVIFGRGNLLTDAPISHVDLLLCRNLLIYFDVAAQTHILGRLKYGLNDGGVLFLGKSESQLKRNSGFITIDPRWRIFQRQPAAGDAARGKAGQMKPEIESDLSAKARKELERLKLYYDAVLATLEPGMLVLDSGDKVISENDKVLKLWELSGKLSGQKLQETELWNRCPELKESLEASRANGPRSVTFDCNASPRTVVTCTIKPILSESGAGQVGTLIYMENVTSRVTLQSTIEELETTAEELQSANEELETTNEELQSTNEELETTNEELQSTNEELETTNEELQSLNEELETTNEELSSRTRELDEVNARYSEMIERMPWPVLLASDDTVVYMFNSAAKKLFGFAHPSEKGIRLQELPLDNNTRQAVLRRHRLVSQSHNASSIRNCRFITNRMDGTTDIYFTPLSGATAGGGVIIIFQVQRQDRAFPDKGTTGPQNRKNKPLKKDRQTTAKKSARKRR